MILPFMYCYYCSYFKRPKVKHIKVTLNVFKYLIGTIHIDMIYEENTSPNLICCSDVNLDSQADAMSLFTSGDIILYAGAPFSW